MQDQLARRAGHVPGHSADWRARVAEYNQQKRLQRTRLQSLTVGSLVTLPRAASFPGGYTASRFRVAHFRRRTPVFEALDPPGFLCRLTAATLAGAKITSPDAAAPDNPEPEL